MNSQISYFNFTHTDHLLCPADGAMYIHFQTRSGFTLIQLHGGARWPLLNKKKN